MFFKKDRAYEDAMKLFEQEKAKSLTKYNTNVLLKDFEINTTPLEEVMIDSRKITVLLDDINEERYKITVYLYHALKVTPIDCFSVMTYYNEYCFRDGRYHTHILEIGNSEWVKELRENLADKRETYLDDVKHYVLLLGDSVIEFVANKIEVLKA